MSLYEGPSLGFPPRRKFASEVRTSATPRSIASQRSLSPSPEMVVDALTNSSLAHAALHSTNPYLRAGVFAVANRAASATSSGARRSASNNANNDALQYASYPHRNVSTSRSRSPSTGAASSMPPPSQGASMGRSTTVRGAPRRPQSAVPVTVSEPSRTRSSRISGASKEYASLTRSSNSRRHRSDTDDMAVYSDSGEHDEAHHPLEESNVWVTEGTFIEDIASPPRHPSNRHGTQPVVVSTATKQQLSRQEGGYYYFQQQQQHAADPNQSGAGDGDSGNPTVKVLLPPPTSSDVFVELMESFMKRFGSIRASTQQYVPLALAKLPEQQQQQRNRHARTRQLNASTLGDEEDDDASTPLQRLEQELGGGRAARPQEPSALIAPVVMTFAASPDRRRVGGSSVPPLPPSATFGHVTSQHSSSDNFYDDAVVDAEAPMLHVSEQLLQLTFTCSHCGAKHMRGLQCSRCQRSLPRLCRCAHCASWMRGKFCSTCGHRQSHQDDHE
jgi:hypothetical protein